MDESNIYWMKKASCKNVHINSIYRSFNNRQKLAKNDRQAPQRGRKVVLKDWKSHEGTLRGGGNIKYVDLVAVTRIYICVLKKGCIHLYWMHLTHFIVSWYSTKQNLKIRIQKRGKWNIWNSEWIYKISNKYLPVSWQPVATGVCNKIIYSLKGKGLKMIFS